MGCRLGGHTESDTTEATSQQQQQQQQQEIPWDISGGGPVAKNCLPMQETRVQSLGKIPRAAGQLTACPAATEPVL